VLGELVDVTSVDLPAVEATLSAGGRWLASGRGAKVMGNPLAAVAWLSGHQVERGRPLRTGDIILTGSLTGHHPVPPGDSRFEADFGPLGKVNVAFHD
jgi:2-keto-4-pentenoate hydratase